MAAAPLGHMSPPPTALVLVRLVNILILPVPLPSVLPRVPVPTTSTVTVLTERQFMLPANPLPAAVPATTILLVLVRLPQPRLVHALTKSTVPVPV